MKNTDLYIGLISGTSIDGVDCVLVQFEDSRPTLLASHFSPTDSVLRGKILELCAGKNIELELLGQVDIELGRIFAQAVTELLDKASVPASNIKAIGSHGQTIWHQPVGTHPFTLQIADPNTIAHISGITTVADFRRRDIAAGGEGAPLAPLLHRNVFQSETFDRAVINIGGISNLTALPVSGQCLAYDTGPGNVLMDYWIGKQQDKRFDEDGSWASTGKCNNSLLALLLDEEYFSRPHPKSTGRELFNGPWLEQKLSAFGETLKAGDVQATLLDFTTTTLARELKKHGSPKEIFVCGGGAHNSALMTQLQQAMGDCSVNSTVELGIDPDWVEAIAFAWMAQQTVAGKKIDTRAFTGASEATVLGGIYQA